MGNTKWTYQKELSFATNYSSFLKIDLSIKTYNE